MSLTSFGAHRKASELFDLVVGDMAQIEKHPACFRLVGQQVASADSICSNIEEGYGRESPTDYKRFLVIARGSAQETRGRYTRLHHWLPPDTIAHRTSLCDEIIAILTTTIKTLRSR